MSSRLVFDPGRHTYSLDGKWVPSVTGIVGKTSAKDGLKWWSAKLAATWCLIHIDDLSVMGEEQWLAAAAHSHDVESKAAMQAGSQLHSVAERLIYGDPVPDVDPDTGLAYPDDVLRMGEQVAFFMDRYQVEPVLVEAPVFHEELRYAGRADLCADLLGERWLIDYKTGASGVWPETALQCCGYAKATHVQLGEKDMLMAQVTKTAALWVRPDSFQLIPLKFDRTVWAAFKASLQAAKFWYQRADVIVGAPLPIPDAEVA